MKKWKKIWMTMWMFLLFLLGGCGRELEERAFPDTLVIRDTPIERVLQKEQEASSKYLDYGQVRCVVLDLSIAEEEKQLKNVLEYMEKETIFARNILFFAGEGEVLDLIEKGTEEERRNLLGFYQKGQKKEAEQAMLGTLLAQMHREESKSEICILKKQAGKAVPSGKIRLFQEEEDEIIQTDEIQQGIAKEILRFHVLANSDTQEDQKLKLKVKDQVVTFLKPLLEDTKDLKETKERILAYQEEVKVEAEKIIKEEGCSYPVQVHLERCYFPMKSYGDCVFPAGTYEALRIEIGQAQGRNWWCVLYPALCFADNVCGVVPEKQKQELQNILTEEEYNSLFEWKENDYQIKSGILKWWNQIFE